MLLSFFVRFSGLQITLDTAFHSLRLLVLFVLVVVQVHQLFGLGVKFVVVILPGVYSDSRDQVLSVVLGFQLMFLSPAFPLYFVLPFHFSFVLLFDVLGRSSISLL